MFSVLNICSNGAGLTADGSERKTPKKIKKKKHKKTVSYDVENAEECEKAEPAKEKKDNEEEEEDSIHKENEPSLNVDSLIKDYKVQSQVSVAKTDFLENLLQEEQEGTTSTNLDTGEESDINTGTKSTRFSKNFKRNRQTMEKTRQNLVKKENEDDDEKFKRAGQLLKKVKLRSYEKC